MTKDVGRTIATALLAALLGAAWAALFYASRPALDLNFRTDPPRLVSGLYPVEHDERWQSTFAWTRDEVTLRLPGLDRRIAWTLQLRVRGGRPGSNPALAFLSDGVPIGSSQTGDEFQDVRLEIPARPERRRGVTISFRVSSTFVPGGADPRALGVMVDRLTLSPASVALAPRDALAGAAASSGLMGAAFALTGVTAGSAIVGAVILSAGDAAIVMRQFGPYTAFPHTAIWLSGWIGAGLILGVWLAGAARGARLRNTAKFAAVFSASALFLTLLVLLHPDMPVGDALFHAHRFEAVLAGNLLFTSIAPGGYAFPYAPGLYVVSSAFARLATRGAADMALLRIVVATTDTLAAVLLYRVVVTGWNDRLAGAVAVALYHLAPLNFSVLVTGNLTNAFAQSLAIPALALIAGRAVRIERRAMTAALGLVLAAAYLSHTSTLAILFVATLACAALFLLRGGPALRSPAWAILAATAAAGVLATVLYYAHFMDTYRAEFARIGHETAAGAPATGGRTILQRVSGVPYGLRINFGVPLLALAVAGAWWQYARALGDRLSLTVAGWLLACAGFLLLGVLTPVDMRYYLAAIPAVAVLAARGAARAWERGPYWRVAAVAALAWIVVSGIQTWWEAIA